jgi:cysteine desulfurase
MEKIYLDYNASTPVDPQVTEVMTYYLTRHFGNPSTTHWAGREAKEAIELARNQVARMLNCRPDEIIFTSGGSEANNLALKGIYFALKEKGNHIITSKIEHPAIMKPLEFLKQLGAEVTYVEVDENCRVDPHDIEKAITDKTILITVMHANNEVGTIQPIEEISRIARKHEVLFHSDTAQSIGKVPVQTDSLGVDLLTLAGHKFYAPKGAGALYVKKGTPLEPLIHGAGHEHGLRAGTESLPLIGALGKAAELVSETDNLKVQQLRDYFWESLQAQFGDELVLNGQLSGTLPNTLNVNFTGRTGDDVLSSVPEIAASTGSACHSGNVELSPVLKAMKVSEATGKGAVRFSLGRYTTKEDIDNALDLLKSRL